jgi:hypothetical protein
MRSRITLFLAASLLISVGCKSAGKPAGEGSSLRSEGQCYLRSTIKEFEERRNEFREAVRFTRNDSIIKDKSVWTCDVLISDSGGVCRFANTRYEFSQIFQGWRVERGMVDYLQMVSGVGLFSARNPGERDMVDLYKVTGPIPLEVAEYRYFVRTSPRSEPVLIIEESSNRLEFDAIQERGNAEIMKKIPEITLPLAPVGYTICTPSS